MTPMTTVIGNVLVDDPCARCAGRRIWVLRYHSWNYDRFICVCEQCGNTVVVEPKRVLLARAGSRMRSRMCKRTA